jgi:hypothetical protein
VAAEAVGAAAIRRFGYRMVLAAGAVLLGAPALAMLAREPPGRHGERQLGARARMAAAVLGESAVDRSL